VERSESKKLIAYSKKTGRQVEIDLFPKNAPKEIYESIGMSNGGQGVDP